jgi:hypothetical protein
MTENTKTPDQIESEIDLALREFEIEFALRVLGHPGVNVTVKPLEPLQRLSLRRADVTLIGPEFKLRTLSTLGDGGFVLEIAADEATDRGGRVYRGEREDWTLTVAKAYVHEVERTVSPRPLDYENHMTHTVLPVTVYDGKVEAQANKGAVYTTIRTDERKEGGASHEYTIRRRWKSTEHKATAAGKALVVDRCLLDAKSNT